MNDSQNSFKYLSSLKLDRKSKLKKFSSLKCLHPTKRNKIVTVGCFFYQCYLPQVLLQQNVLRGVAITLELSQRTAWDLRYRVCCLFCVFKEHFLSALFSKTERYSSRSPKHHKKTYLLLAYHRQLVSLHCYIQGGKALHGYGIQNISSTINISINLLFTCKLSF